MRMIVTLNQIALHLPHAGALMPLFREAVLGPAFTPGSGRGNPYDRSASPSVSPPKAARRRAKRRAPIMHRDEPVLKNGPNTASRRRPLKRPQRAPGQSPAISSWVNPARYTCQRPSPRFGQHLAIRCFLGMVIVPSGWRRESAAIEPPLLS
jgi:hypothetical protein